jgi:hypothetical protein
MRRIQSVAFVTVVLFFCAPPITLSQNASQNPNLIVNGQLSQVQVIQVKGRSYADLDTLASALNGSLSFAGNQIALSVPIGSVSSPGSAATGAPASSTVLTRAPDPGFSKGFLNAGIEQMSTLREWHTALTTAIQNGYPVNANMLAPYRNQASKNLNFAANAVSTSADRDAQQLLTKEFQNMVKLSDKYVNARANMTYISPDSLQHDSLNQRIIACGHFLGSMAASGQFADDGSCG